MGLKKILLPTAFFISLFAGFGQSIKTLPENPAEFIQELPAMFEQATAQKSEIDPIIILDSITGYWYSNVYSDEESSW